MTREELEAENAKLRKALEIYERERARFSQIYEKTDKTISYEGS